MSQSTGCSQPELLERLYQHFAQPAAWDVSPGAALALQRIRESGVPCQLATISSQQSCHHALCAARRLGRLPRRCAGPSEDPRVRSAPPFVVLTMLR